jgi:very-short-patch-repair endonuclease
VNSVTGWREISFACRETVEQTPESPACPMRPREIAMKLLPLLPVLLVLLALAAVVAQRLRGGARRGPVTFKATPLMSAREQAMYWRLKETFPTSIVLAQVAFSALVTSELRHRDYFDRKVADFVLCDPSLKVQFVIELDDASRKGRERADAAREKILTRAGYKLLRFANVPGQDDLKAYIRAQVPEETRGTSSRVSTKDGGLRATRSMALQDH